MIQLIGMGCDRATLSLLKNWQRKGLNVKKIESRQMPRARIARPLLVGGLMLVAVAGTAEAQGCVMGAKPSSGSSGSSGGQSEAAKNYKKFNTPSTTIQSTISKSPGCVMGAVPYSGGTGSKSSGSPPKKGTTSSSPGKSKTKKK